jgi:myo-inositol 2-dehydrogenase / D-chiro-inositol 1-dehydrogenase
MITPHRPSRATARRDFLKQSGGIVAGAALASAIASRSYAGENNTIKVALVGCGGRGTGAAANALSTRGPVKLWAMADVFENRLQVSFNNLSKQFPKQMEVPAERRFLGLDGYQKAINTLEGSDVVILATPPAFRPIHLEYAVEKGRNVFMEKSFAVDAPGVRRVLKLGQLAQQKNLKIAGGLNNRHYGPLEEAIGQIQQGAIGEVITCWAYREHGPVGFKRRQPGMSELLHQIENYGKFTWLNGTFMLDYLIHNLDVCCWIKGAWPVSAQGQGGRQIRSEPDQMFDHFAMEYTFPDGTRLFAQGRHMAGCWGFFGDVIHGAKGCAVLGEGITEPRIYKGYQATTDKLIWEHKGPMPNSYQVEHDLLFEAIRENKPYNEAERCAYAAMTGILGRMAAESGKMITWEEAFASNLELAPGLERYTLDSTPPVMPDATGRYPIAMPGVTKVL